MELNYLNNILHKHHSTTDYVSCSFFYDVVLCIQYITQEYPVEVLYHAVVLLALVVSFHLTNILVEPFSIVITHCSEVQMEEVSCGSGESEF